MYYLVYVSDHKEVPRLMNYTYRKVVDRVEPSDQFEF